MEKKFLIFFSSVFLIIFYCLLPNTYNLKVRADECDTPSSLNLNQISGCLTKLNDDLGQISKANQTNKQQLQGLQLQVNNLKTQLNSLSQQLDLKEEEINNRNAKLDEQYQQLSVAIRSFYVESYYPNLLSVLLKSTNAQEALFQARLYMFLSRRNRNAIVNLVNDLNDLTKSKDELDKNITQLTAIKGKIDEQADFLAGEVAKASAYEQQLTNKISSLTARQQEILTAKAEVFQTSVGEVPLADDPAASPNYNPGFSPAFAVFSFGAPHRKGLSQYGAWGRAKSGQSAEDILHAYYGGGIEIKKDYSTSININVQGYGSYNIEDYVKRIYEMPSSWTDNDSAALRAQAVAARSYGLAYTNNGSGSICATENCQVFQPGEKGGAWSAAVDATRGWVLVANGQPFSAWYAASSGGYNFSYTSNGYSTPGIWDTKCGNRTCWTNDAYEKIAASPWFYKAWYKERDGSTCGRSHPWLTEEEFADILNAWVVFSKGSDEDHKHVTPTDTGCWGGDPYSISQMKDKANSLSGSYSSISSVSVDYSSDGSTNSVRVSTNNGEVSISGSDFKTIYNLRAPGKISIKSSLFNLEKK